MRDTLSNPFKTLKRWLLLLLLTFAMHPLHVAAESIELCTTLDGSESIVPSDFQIQLEGLAQAVRDPNVVPQDGSVTISIVHFATEARLEVEPTLVNSAAVADQIAAQVSQIQQAGLGQFTNIAHAIDLCAQQFSFNSDKQVIDIVTDGEHNRGGDPIESADNAVAKGVDAINALGIGHQVEADKLRMIVRPQPASANLLQEGFFFQISDYELFVNAISAKISAEAGGQVVQITDAHTSSMVSLGGGLCLATSNGVVQIQTCTGNPDQQWVLVGSQFKNPAGQCLSSIGNTLTVAACDDSLGQSWSLQGSQLVNGLAQCLDVPESDIYVHGAKVQLSECTGDANQTWKLSGTILMNGTGRCLDIPNWDENGKITYTWDCHSGKNQRWTLSGSRLVNDYGRCLDIHAPDADKNGGQSQIWDCLEGDVENQTWTLNGNGELVNGTGKCLDVDAVQATHNGAKVQTWDCHGQANQQWQFLFANSYAGELSGLVKNAISLSGINGVNIDVKANGVLTSNGETTTDGSYIVNNVPTKQTVTAEFSRGDYIPATYHDINIEFGNRLALDQVLLVPNAYAGSGTMSGTAINGVTGSGLDNVSLRLRSGMNAKTGNVVTEAVSGADGSYQLQAAGGNYTLEASKLGFVTNYTHVEVLGGEVRTEQNVTLVPILGSGEVRAVLTWGRTPMDLDAHATVPLNNGERFHVFWPIAERGSLTETPFVFLDIDDVFSYGPETMTFAQTNLAGVYRYSVHDYTNRTDSNSKGLAASGAQVNIYNEYGLIATLNVPNKAGTLWTVFEIREGSLHLINEIIHESDSRSVKSGTTTQNSDYDLMNLMSK